MRDKKATKGFVIYGCFMATAPIVLYLAVILDIFGWIGGPFFIVGGALLANGCRAARRAMQSEKLFYRLSLLFLLLVAMAKIVFGIYLFLEFTQPI